jgi:hypothetical protein
MAKIIDEAHYLLFEGTANERIEFVNEDALAYLLEKEIIFLNCHHWKKDWPEEARKTLSVFVNCDDVFAWACADAEELNMDELEDLFDHAKQDDVYGPIVWCCKKRNEMPIRPHREHIQRSGLWNLEEMGLEPNGHEKVLKEFSDSKKPIKRLLKWLSGLIGCVG